MNPTALVPAPIGHSASRAEASLGATRQIVFPPGFAFLGLESLHPFCRPILLGVSTRAVSLCHVSPHHVRPLQMSRTVFSLTPAVLSCNTSCSIIWHRTLFALTWNISITCSTDSFALVFSTEFMLRCWKSRAIFFLQKRVHAA